MNRMAASPPAVSVPPSAKPTRLSISTTISTPSPSSLASPSSGTSTPLAIKPAAPLANMASAAISQFPKTSITSKEWVIPPRPKPGRKPATDTPPTKRKAQNRAAQRAFRERRAARVGELEEQLDEQREQHDRVERDLQDQVNGLDLEVQNLRTRCVMFEGLLKKEREERQVVNEELEALKKRWNEEQTRRPLRNDSLPSLPSQPSHSRHHSLASQNHPRDDAYKSRTDHRGSGQAFTIAQMISPPETSNSNASTNNLAGCGSCGADGSCACVEEVLASSSVGCGNCSVGTKCECLEETVKNAGTLAAELKRPPSASPIEPDQKRQRADPSHFETDFTSYFSKKREETTVQPSTFETQPQTVLIPPRDSCGFCTEGTYCMCAEAAAAQNLPPISQQVQTPPPSVDDVGPPPIEVTSTGAIKLPRLQSLNTRASRQGGCGPNGPGSCAQCLADPKSGLFCRSLAASFDRSGGPAAGGCCGGSAGGGCCKDRKPPPTSNPGLSLSCADAYKTISSHKNFEQASEDINTWLPKLKAIPREVGEGSTGPGPRGRLPIEVETASIMSVLKGFDVRFGSGR